MKKLLIITILFIVGCGSSFELAPVPCDCDFISEYFGPSTSYKWVVEYIETERIKEPPCESGIYFEQVGEDSEGRVWGSALRWDCEN